MVGNVEEVKAAAEKNGFDIAGAEILEADTRANIAAADGLLGILLVGMHLEETRDALFLAGTGVEHIASGLDVA